jgi:hypothetical protein
MLINIETNNLVLRLRTKFSFDNNISKQQGHQKLGSSFIVKQINVVAFQLKLPSSMRIHLVFHVSLLEPYHASTIPRKIHDSLPPIEIDGEHEYEVEDI